MLFLSPKPTHDSDQEDEDLEKALALSIESAKEEKEAWGGSQDVGGYEGGDGREGGKDGGAGEESEESGCDDGKALNLRSLIRSRIDCR